MNSDDVGICYMKFTSFSNAISKQRSANGMPTIL